MSARKEIAFWISYMAFASLPINISMELTLHLGAGFRGQIDDKET